MRNIAAVKRDCTKSDGRAKVPLRLLAKNLGWLGGSLALPLTLALGVLASASAWPQPLMLNDPGASLYLKPGPTNRCAPVISSGLVAWWPLDNFVTNSGVVFAADVINGTLLTNFNSAPLISAVISNGVSFTASSSQVLLSSVNLPTGTLPSGAAARTLCCWFSGLGTSDQVLCGYGENSADEVFVLEYNGSGRLQLDIGADTMGFSWTHDSNTHFLCVAYSGGDISSGTTIYLDGASQSISGSSATPDTATEHCYIGGFYVDTLAPLLFTTGIIDDVRIYNRALSSTEVSDIYNAGQAGVSGLTGVGCP